MQFRGFIVYLTPCSRQYQFNLLNSYCRHIYNATTVVNNLVPGNSSQSLLLYRVSYLNTQLYAYI